MNGNSRLPVTRLYYSFVNPVTVHPPVSYTHLILILSAFAPHLGEELWQILGHDHSLAYEPWPEVNPEYLKVDIIEYPVSFNGKMRFKIELPAEMNKDDIEKAVLADARSEKWTGGSKLSLIHI